MSMHDHNSRPIGRVLAVLAMTGALASAGVQAADNTAPTANNFTLAGSTVGNTASAQFSVSSVPQTAVTSNNDQFTVDNRVNVFVTEINNLQASTTAGDTDFAGNAAASFFVTNTGNSVQDIVVSAANLADATADPHGGNADNWDVTAPFIYYVDVNSNNVYDSGTDTVLPNSAGTYYLDEVAKDTTVRVLVVPTSIPTTVGDADVTNGNNAVISLTATARIGGGAAALGGTLSQTGDGVGDTQGGAADIVFADAAGTDDGARDAAHSDRDAYRVAGAVVTLSKSSAVLSDGVSASNFKRIPGATVRYTLTVSNAAGASTAEDTTITDTISATELTFVTGSLRVSTDDAICGNGTDTNPADSITANNAAGAWVNSLTPASVTTVNFGGTALAAADIAASGTITFCYDVTID